MPAPLSAICKLIGGPQGLTCQYRSGSLLLLAYAERYRCV